MRKLALLVVCGCLASPCAAQTGGTVTGVVKDETGGVLPGVTVDLHAGATEIEATTDGAGAYRLDKVPPGPAEINFKLINFTLVRRNLAVVAGQTITADAVLGLSLTADVVVTGTETFRNIADLENPAENLVGVASAASQGAITAAQLQARPLMRPAEVLEAVPGLIASQHSGEGKANQYYLRGFNLDHGSDFATTIAGMPINTPTGAHFHGYSDTNLLMPELISGVQFKKGPYFAEDGDFSAAGSANINYVNQLDRPIISVSGGGQGWGRILAAASPEVGSGTLLAGLEVAHNDGPWESPDDLGKMNGIVRFSRGDTRNGFSITGMGYAADWNSTDQVPQRAIDSGLITRFGSIDPTDGGSTGRYSFTFDGQRAGSNASTRVTAFAVRYRLNLFSNFTYYLDDPINGDQFEQADRRWITGGRVTYRRLGEFAGRHVESAVGVQLRHDAMDQIGFFKTIAQRRVATYRDDNVGQTSVGFFGQSDIEWTRTFRTTIGLRGDVFAFDVNASNPLNTGSGTDAVASPKFTAVLGPWRGTEFYVNGGYGYHSNDARGATLTVDPITGEPTEALELLTQARGAEIGVRTVRFRGLQSTAALWYLGFDSELLFVGDAGVTEASRPSRRFGVEWTNYLRLNPWLTAEADVSFSRARFTDDDPAGNLIPGALDRVLSGAVTIEPSRKVFGSIRLRHFGPRPLTEDGSVTSHSTTIWNGDIGVGLNERVRLMLEGFNLLDSDVADVDYYYTSRLPDEPFEGVDDIHTHPSIPRTFRVGLTVAF
ncbi:MAG TPA: TonB-dependent receptor [Vicinamibacterales bacterium]|nr:TonB-dependent receptor [Vicinamibacterales bacterium]